MKHNDFSYSQVPMNFKHGIDILLDTVTREPYCSAKSLPCDLQVLQIQLPKTVSKYSEGLVSMGDKIPTMPVAFLDSLGIWRPILEEPMQITNHGPSAPELDQPVPLPNYLELDTEKPPSYEAVIKKF